VKLLTTYSGKEKSLYFLSFGKNLVSKMVSNWLDTMGQDFEFKHILISHLM